MRSDAPKMFRRDEVLGGLPARRASALVFAIEGRTAQLATRRRAAMATYVNERSVAQRERAFFDALAGGRDLPVRPTAPQLEMHAEEWMSLVPPDPALRAATARLLGQAYRLPEERTPRLRAALGLDDPDVVAAFEQQFDAPVTSVFSPEPTLTERWSWHKAALAHRVESLPPFWMAFAVTLTETVGAGVLALPIAVAAIGPLPAVALLLLFGLVNMLTVAALCEAITRNGGMRYGTAYFGHLVRTYLGRPGSIMLSSAVLVLNVVVLIVMVLGAGLVLGNATGTPPWTWVLLLGVGHVLVLRRETLNATIASAMVVGAVNISLLVAISAVALPHVRRQHLLFTDLPLVGGGSFDPALIGLVFGVILVTYFGHTSAANVAKVVLRRDPSGRSLLRGNVAAMAAVMGVNIMFVLAVGGALGRDRLVGIDGTSLEPLADLVGGGVTVLGSVFAVLAMGFVSLYFSLGLRNQVAEWSANITRHLGRDRRFAVEVAPVVAVLLLTVGLVAGGRETFTAPLGALGALVLPLLGGVFPMVMIAAARRRGEYVPGTAPRVLGRPVVIAATAALFLGAVLLHGLVIWTAPLHRAAALAVTGIMAAVVVATVRDGALRRRAVVELQIDARLGNRARASVTSAGEPAIADMTVTTGSGDESLRTASADLGPGAGLQSLRVRLPEGTPSELKVWTHRITEDGTSVALGATVSVGRDGTTASAAHRVRDGSLTVTAVGPGVELTITPD